jgi:hypothetical protein
MYTPVFLFLLFLFFLFPLYFNLIDIPPFLPLQVHIIGLLVRHATWIADELSDTGILQVLSELLLRDKNNKVKRKAAAALGELLFYVATQQETLEPADREKVWPVPKSTINILTRCLRAGEDDVVQHYVAKTIENISAQSHEFTRVWFVQQEVLYSLLHLYNTSRNESLRLTCASALSHLMRRMPALVNTFLLIIHFVSHQYSLYIFFLMIHFLCFRRLIISSTRWAS